MLDRQLDDAEAMNLAAASGGLLVALAVLFKTIRLRTMTLALRVWRGQPSRWFRRAAS